MPKPHGNLCLPLHGNINNLVTTFGNSEQYVLSFLQNLLPRTDQVESVSAELRKNFILNKVKLKGSEGRGRVKRRRRHLSAKRRVLLGLNKARSINGVKYSDFLPLNALWESYMKETLSDEWLLKMPRDLCDLNWERVNQRLAKVDFHGAKISVVKSKCPSLVGKEGIVVRDTKHVFTICEMSDTVQAIPKQVVEIDIHMKDLTLRVLGKHLLIRPTERTVRKFKQTRIIDL